MLAVLPKVPYLNARTALFFYPLFALQIFARAVLLSQYARRAALVLAGSLAVGAGFNFAKCANLRDSYKWWFDANTFAVLDYLRDRHIAEHRSAPFRFDCQWLEENEKQEIRLYFFPPKR